MNGFEGVTLPVIAKGLCFTFNIKFGLARLIRMMDEQADDRQQHSSMYGPKY